MNYDETTLTLIIKKILKNRINIHYPNYQDAFGDVYRCFFGLIKGKTLKQLKEEFPLAIEIINAMERKEGLQ